jgi:ribosomal protein L40E
LGLLVAGAAVTVIAIIVVGGLFYRRSKRRDKSVTRIYDQAVTIPVSKIDEDTTAREATRAYAPADTDKIHEPNPPTELEVEEALSVTYCHECGAENMKDSKFCRKCAAKIDSPSK